jgi:hypothetical protein
MGYNLTSSQTTETAMKNNFTVWFVGVEGQNVTVDLYEPEHYTDDVLFQIAAAKLDESVSPLFVETWENAA